MPGWIAFVLSEQVEPWKRERNLELGAVFIREHRDARPTWHGIETEEGTVHSKVLETQLELTPKEGRAQYMDMKNDAKFYKPPDVPGERKVSCYGLTEVGEAWVERLLSEYAAGKKPWFQRAKRN
jgi:hypothetical protein